MRQPLRCARKPVRSSVYIGEVLNANAYPSDYRGAIWPAAQPAQLTRKIAAVHVHHTWRPRRQDFRGLATVEAMRKFHMEQNGWSDLAQHLTIDPQGGLWTGRNWNLAPASATGHNGTAGEGPFMIEMVGDFDAGQDPFDGEQRTAAIETVAHLVRAFGLQDADVKSTIS